MMADFHDSFQGKRLVNSWSSGHGLAGYTGLWNPVALIFRSHFPPTTISPEL
jgi:hypothetical protein